MWVELVINKNEIQINKVTTNLIICMVDCEDPLAGGTCLLAFMD